MGTLADIKAELARLSGIRTDLMFIADVYNCRVFRTLTDRDPVKNLRASDEVFVFELGEDVRAAERETEQQRLRAEEGLVVGVKVLAKWKSMRGKEYKGFVETINDDGTFNIIFADGDRNLNVEPERIRKVDWVNAEKDPLQKGFSEAPDAMVSIQLGMRVSKVQKSYMSYLGGNKATVVMEPFGYPIVLSFPRNITNRELHDLVWEQASRFVLEDADFDEENWPFALKQQEKAGNRRIFEIPRDDEVVDLKAQRVLLLDWSTAGFKKAFDKAAMAARRKGVSYLAAACALPFSYFFFFLV
jgi:hypothetical protein